MRLFSLPASLTILLPALAAPLCFAPSHQGVTVEAGTKVTKTFSKALILELVDVSISVDGEEQEVPEEAKPVIKISNEERISFVDEYVRVTGGRSTETLRTFQEISNTSLRQMVPPGDAEGLEIHEEGKSDLLDTTVRFVWGGDDEGYAITFPEGEDGAPDLLEGLEGDADYLFLLSGEELEVGATWEVEAIAFDRISNPSGDLKIDSEDEDDDQDEQFAKGFREGLTGELSATVESMEEGVAKIDFTGDISTLFDVTFDNGREEANQSFEIEFELSGTLIWDTERGLAQGFELRGDAVMKMTNEASMQGAELVRVQTFEGTFESTAAFE